MVTVLTEGQESNPNQRGTLTLINSVSPGYFDTMRIPLVEGRKLSDFDRRENARVAVVNEAMARHFWPGQNAIGKRMRFTIDNMPREVVGVVKNSVTVALGEQPQPLIFLPLDQQFSPFVSLHALTEASPSAILPTVLGRVQTLDENLALTNPTTIQSSMAGGLWAPRMGAALFGIFGLLGMLLASIGIYGVMAYTVAQRTNEIGIRMALGARPGDVLRLVVGQGMRLTVIGIAIGVVGALAITRLMGTLLFNVSPNDPLTFIAVSTILAAVAFLAGWLPAWRAARIDPLLALRQD
jgi:predicted permease